MYVKSQKVSAAVGALSSATAWRVTENQSCRRVSLVWRSLSAANSGSCMGLSRSVNECARICVVGTVFETRSTCDHCAVTVAVAASGAGVAAKIGVATSAERRGTRRALLVPMDFPVVLKTGKVRSGPGHGGRRAGERTDGSVGKDNAFLEENAAVEAELAGSDDGEGSACALVKSLAGNAGYPDAAAFGLVDDDLADLLDLGDLIGGMDLHHAGDGLVDEGVERKKLQSGFENRGEVGAIEANQALGIGDGRKVGVDDGDLVAMAHGGQDVQELRRMEDRKSFQHGWSIL